MGAAYCSPSTSAHLSGLCTFHLGDGNGKCSSDSTWQSQLSAAATSGFTMSWERWLSEPAGVTQLCGSDSLLIDKAGLLGSHPAPDHRWRPSCSPWEDTQRWWVLDCGAPSGHTGRPDYLLNTCYPQTGVHGVPHFTEDGMVARRILGSGPPTQ